MKRFTILILLFIYSFSSSCQELYSNLILSQNLPTSIQYDIFEVPLKIEQVNSEKQINYSKPEGLLQSFYSANTKEWAISDYLNKSQAMVRDKEHFEAVRKRIAINNYIQLETIYQYNYNNRQFALLKYAIIDEHIPFHLLGILSTEKVGGRWYISQMLNQNQVSTLLANFDNSVLLGLFSKKRNTNLDLQIEKLMQNKGGQFSFAKADRLFDDLINQGKKTTLKTLKDKRNVDETFKPHLAIEKATPKSFKFELPHPFLMDSTSYYMYSKKENENNDNNAKWLNTPEFSLLKDSKNIKLDSKFAFYYQNKMYYVINYYSSKKQNVVIVDENGVFREELKSFQDIKKLFLKLQKGMLIKLSQSNPENSNLARIKKASSASDDVLNLNLFIDYLENNPKEKQFVFEN